MERNSKDLKFSFFCGFLVSLCFLLIIFNPKIKELSFLWPFKKYIIFLSFLFPFMFVLAIKIASLFKKQFPILFQFAKFVEVGVLNTFVDFGVLNVLLFFSEEVLGFKLIIFNSISFLAAVTNSYWWNKIWTFKKAGKFQQKEFSIFLMVSIIGLTLNSLIVYFGSLFLSFIQISTAALINLVKVCATLIVMFWNFFGYKLFVFERK